MGPAIDVVRQLAGAEHWLAVAVTIRRDATPQASVVNAGVLDHPLRHEPVVGFVAGEA